MIVNEIRDLRESKNLSQDAVAAECGLSYSIFCRIEAGTGKTTQAEVDAVLRKLKKMKAGTRKIGGRPFADANRQAAVIKAREEGTSIAQALAELEGETEDLIGETAKPAATKAPRKRTSRSRKTA